MSWMTTGPILLVGVITALACAVPGTLLVVQGKSLLSDAISHSLLPGIALAFLLVPDLSSPLLILGAGLMGVVLVLGIEALEKTGFIKNDAAMAMVFPALFSIGVLLISGKFSGLHLDLDVVLLGNIAQAPLDVLRLEGIALGPRSFYVMLFFFLLQGAFVLVFYKELFLGSFDPSLARHHGLRPLLLQRVFILITSFTLVGAFDAVGAILVVSFFIVPASGAILLFSRLSGVYWGALAISTLGALAGVFTAVMLDVAVSGTMAVVMGLFFLLILFLAPENGYLAQLIQQKRQKHQFSLMILLGHLYHHKENEEAEKRKVEALPYLLGWERKEFQKIQSMGLEWGLLFSYDEFLVLSEKGNRAVIVFGEGQWPLAQ